jgi:hypothetical protein
MAATLTILTPVPDVRAGAASQAEERRLGNKVRLGLLSNGKPNTELLLDGLMEVLGPGAGMVAELRERKNSASEPADEAILNRLTSSADLVVSATAD